LAVLSGHFAPTVLGYKMLEAGPAVLGFFVLSGFYMAMVLDTKYRWDLPAFYWNRLLRLWPSYLLVLAASLAAYLAALALFGVPLGPFVPLVKAHGRLDHATLAATLLAQASMLGPGFSHLFEVTRTGGLAWSPNSYMQANSLWRLDLLPQTWSLSTEIVFYALAPWIVRWRSRTLALAFLGGLAVRLALGLMPPPYAWCARLIPLDLTVFCAGVLLWRQQRDKAPALGPRGRAGLAGLAVAYLACASYASGIVFQALWAPLAAAALIPWLMEPGRGGPWERTLGELSYPLFLCHLLVGRLIVLGGFDGPWLTVVGAAVSLAIAYLIHRLLERPLERRFKRVPRPAR